MPTNLSPQAYETFARIAAGSHVLYHKLFRANQSEQFYIAPDETDYDMLQPLNLLPISPALFTELWSQGYLYLAGTLPHQPDVRFFRPTGIARIRWAAHQNPDRAIRVWFDLRQLLERLAQGYHLHVTEFNGKSTRWKCRLGANTPRFGTVAALLKRQWIEPVAPPTNSTSNPSIWEWFFQLSLTGRQALSKHYPATQPEKQPSQEQDLVKQLGDLATKLAEIITNEPGLNEELLSSKPFFTDLMAEVRQQCQQFIYEHRRIAAKAYIDTVEAWASTHGYVGVENACAQLNLGQKEFNAAVELGIIREVQPPNPRQQEFRQYVGRYFDLTSVTLATEYRQAIAQRVSLTRREAAKQLGIRLKEFDQYRNALGITATRGITGQRVYRGSFYRLSDVEKIAAYLHEQGPKGNEIS